MENGYLNMPAYILKNIYSVLQVFVFTVQIYFQLKFIHKIYHHKLIDLGKYLKDDKLQ